MQGRGWPHGQIPPGAGMDLPAMCQHRICKRVMGQVCPQTLRGRLLLCFWPWLSPLPEATHFLKSKGCLPRAAPSR